MAFHSRRWTRQPQGISGANPEWLRAWGFSALADACGRGNSWSRGALPEDISSAGRGLRVNARATATTGGRVEGIGPTISVVFVAEKHANITGGSDFIFGEHGALVGPYNWGFYESAYTANSIYFFAHNGTSGVQVGGANWVPGSGPTVFVATYDGSQVAIYKNGSVFSSGAQSGGLRANTAALLQSCFWQSTSNPDFTIYAAAISSDVLSPEEVRADFSDTDSTYGRVFRPRRIWVPQAAITGLPTLSLPTYTPGSLTATGFRPRVTAT